MLSFHILQILYYCIKLFMYIFNLLFCLCNFSISPIIRNDQKTWNLSRTKTKDKLQSYNYLTLLKNILIVIWLDWEYKLKSFKKIIVLINLNDN